MVNKETTVIGRNFTPGMTVDLIECSATSWIVPNYPCNSDNSVTATANRKGAFKVKFKAEACTGSSPTGPADLSELCYIGVPKPSGIDTVMLQPNTRIVVTFP